MKAKRKAKAPISPKELIRAFENAVFEYAQGPLYYEDDKYVVLLTPETMKKAAAWMHDYLWGLRPPFCSSGSKRKTAAKSRAGKWGAPIDLRGQMVA